MKPETKFKLKVRKDLASMGCMWFFKTNEVSTLGIPDFIICARGLFIAIELKKDEKSKPTDLQVYTLEKIREAGGIGYIAYPDIWEDVLAKIKDVLKRRGKKPLLSLA